MIAALCSQLKEKQAEIAQQPQLYEVDELDDEDEVEIKLFFEKCIRPKKRCLFALSNQCTILENLFVFCLCFVLFCFFFFDIQFCIFKQNC